MPLTVSTVSRTRRETVELKQFHFTRPPRTPRLKRGVNENHSSLVREYEYPDHGLAAEPCEQLKNGVQPVAETGLTALSMWLPHTRVLLRRATGSRHNES